jgi:AcrR family transcriptional regulator
MSLAGLYHYFSSKEELLFLIQHHTFGAILERLEERLEGVHDPRRRLSVMVSNHLEHFLARMDDLRVCARELESLSGHYFEQVEALRRRYFGITLEIVESIGKEAGGSRAEPRLATLYLFGMLNWIYMWYPDTDGVSGEEMTEQLLALFLEGYLPREED